MQKSFSSCGREINFKEIAWLVSLEQRFKLAAPGLNEKPKVETGMGFNVGCFFFKWCQHLKIGTWYKNLEI